MCTLKASPLHVCTKCYTSALCVNVLLKKTPVAFERDKRGVSWKELDGQRGNPKELMKYSVLHVKKNYCRRRSGMVGRQWESRLRRKETEWGDTLQVGTIVRLNLALIQDSTKGQGKSQEGLHRWGVGRCGTKPAGSHSSSLTRYVIRGTKQK